MRVVKNLRDLTWLKGHPAASQVDHLDRVHSDQMVLEMIRWGGWSSRAKLNGGLESQIYGPRDCPAATTVGNNRGSQTMGQRAK